MIACSFPRRPLLVAVLACASPLIFGCGGEGGAPPPAELTEGARVRFLAPRFARSVRTGVVARAAECTAILTIQPGEPHRRYVVPIEQLESLEVSTLYDGSRAADGTDRGYVTGADTTGERWRAVPVQPLIERYGGCEPGM